jgi:hypothetical protein
MANSLSEASKAIVGALAEALSEPHLGIKLPRALIVPLATYLHATLKMEDPEEVEEMGADALLAATGDCEAFEDGVPVSVGLTVKTWYENEIGPKIVKKAPPTSKHDDDVEVAEPTPAKIGARAKARMSAEEEADVKAMGLAGSVEVKCLALSSETGQVHAPHEVSDMGWGADPRLTDIAKQRRKSGMDSLTKHLDDKDADAVLVHFSSLIRDLTNEGLTQEVSVVTGWLMELQQVFVEDRPGMLIYVKEYMRRYKGRAFPVKFDFAIFAKALSSAKAKGGLSDDQKEDLKKIKGMQAKIESMTSKNDALRNEMSALKTKVAGIKVGGPGGGSGAKPTCHFCGEEGHMSFNCKLNPDSSKFDSKFKAKKAPKKADEAAEDEE